MPHQQHSLPQAEQASSTSRSCGHTQDDGDKHTSLIWDHSHPWLVVSLCDGIGGLFLALEQACLPFHGITAEKDAGLRGFVHRKWCSLQAHSDCSSISAQMVIAAAKEHKCAGVFLAGGPPCQGSAGAGRPIVAFCQIKQELEAGMRAAGLSFACLLEALASMEVDRRREISDLFNGRPTLIQAADFGWVQRARLYWGLEGFLQSGIIAGRHWEYHPPGQHFEDVGVLRWLGDACPACWVPDSGWHWQGCSRESSRTAPIAGGAWLAAYAGGSFDTLTACFPHPPDRGSRSADETQLTRFHKRWAALPAQRLC